MTRIGHRQITLASLRSLSTSAFASAHLDAGLALRRLDHLQRLQARRHVHAERLGLQVLERLLLRLHDVRQRDVARLVQPQVGGDDRRQLDRDRLQAAVHLARDLRLFAFHLQLRGESRLRPAQQRREHLAGLVGIVVDRLLAEDHQLRAFLLTHRLQQLRDRQRLQLLVGLDQDRAVGADRERGAQRLLAGLRRRRTRPRSRWRCRLPSAAPPPPPRSRRTGFIDILTFAVSTPVPSALTRTLTLKSTTRLTLTRTFMGEAGEL